MTQQQPIQAGHSTSRIKPQYLFAKTCSLHPKNPTIMKKSNEPQKPFFAKFLESQKMEDPANEVVGGGGAPF